jgi:glycosyltransferase involved in cell wall biosynthesis
VKVNLLVSSVAHTGGHAVTFEYAHRLQARGHQVTVCVPRLFPDHGWRGVAGRARWLKASVGNAVVHGDRPAWVDFQVPVARPLTLSSLGVPDADVTVASAWTTAEALARLPARCGAKAYHVQDVETFAGPAERVVATYRLGLPMATTSPYLRGEVEALSGAPVTLCPLGLDTERFSPSERPPPTDGPLRVLLLHHQQARKGTAVAQEALARARARGTWLEATAFGVHVPQVLREVDATVHAPTGAALVELYRRHHVYLALPPSEGWGLTVTEAMSCGLAVVSTPVGALGHVDPTGEATWPVPSANPAAAADALAALAADPGRRAALGERARAAAVARLSWEDSTDAFEAFLVQAREAQASR